MEFAVNTKPLSDALSLAIINSNISSFYMKSCVTQLTIEDGKLRINTEASNIFTEIFLKGSCDSSDEEHHVAFVNSATLKQLVSTFDSDIVSFEFVSGGVILHSGKSKFTLANMVDAVDIELTRPVPDEVPTPSSKLNSAVWKFIKDNQMYSIAMSFIHPVYTKVFIGESGDVLVGDFDNSLFTHSKHNEVLGSTCLLSSTIINLLDSVPEDTSIAKAAKSYILTYESDSFSYTSKFDPQYETDEGVGSYNSDIFLNMMAHDELGVQFESSKVNKLMNQASILSTSSEDTIKIVASKDTIILKDKNVDGSITCKGNFTSEFELEFKTEALKKVISNYGDETINIGPVYQEDTIVGILLWNDKLTTILAGVE